MTVHVLDAAVALGAEAEDLWRGRTSPEYANFIGPYGGVTAAQMLQAVLLHPQRLGEPVAFTINFAASGADGEFLVRARPARTNRSTRHWSVEMLQEGQPVATATALTAVRRSTWGAREAVPPSAPPPESLPAEPVRPVPWTRHYDRRYAEGAVPSEWKGQDGGSSRTVLWLRDHPQRPLDFLALTAMADNFFPRLWLRRASQVPLGTVSMTVYYHAGSDMLRATGAGWVLAQAQGQGFRDGYLDQAGLLWNQSGELLATTQQLMYYKE